jgi:hypothetical protein
VTTSQARRRVYSHSLLHLPPVEGARWRIGYHAEPATEPGLIRASRAVAHQIASDLLALRTETLAIAAHTAQSYRDVIGAVDARLPRIEMDGEHLVADWRHVTADSNALQVTDPGPDGRYTIGLDLGWQQVDAELCDTVRDDTTWPSPVLTAYQAYVGCFTDPVAALLHLAEHAGIAVAWLDRGAIEADSRPLSHDEWNLIRAELYQYDEYVSATGEVNSLFLDRIFSDAGLERYGDDAGTVDDAIA